MKLPHWRALSTLSLSKNFRTKEVGFFKSSKPRCKNNNRKQNYIHTMHSDIFVFFKQFFLLIEFHQTKTFPLRTKSVTSNSFLTICLLFFLKMMARTSLEVESFIFPRKRKGSFFSFMSDKCYVLILLINITYHI